jgi:membrane-bound ClpP family serine protease
MNSILSNRGFRLVILLGIGVVVGATILYALSRFYDFGTLEFVLIAIVITVVGDIIYAWNNERAIQQGKVKLHNDILGLEATVIEAFSPAQAGFRGKVTLRGERWAANSSKPLSEGETVHVQSREGMVLSVE